jgi:pimeloyl-ACP methyl ester carboxylesterase
MALRQIAGLPGAPWRRPLLGMFDRLTVQSEVLRGNPLGDPVIRPLYVYRSPGVVAGTASSAASVYVLQGFTGQLDRWLAREPFEPTLVERLDALYDPDATVPCPEAVVVLVDAWTSLGGSQFVNSPGTGRYADYICDELVPFIDASYPTAQTPARRIVAGKSSGGYGAMVLAMQRPDRFGALISHAGDALFEVCYEPDFAVVARTLRDHFEGSYERFWQAFANRERFDYGRFGACLEIYALAAAYSPDLQHPGQVLLPFDPSTGRLHAEVWRQWLAHDPVRMAADHAQALRGLRAVLLEGGRRDEYHLDLGAQAFAAELDKVGARYHLELFDGGHGGTAYRYAPAIRTVLHQLESGATMT